MKMHKNTTNTYKIKKQNKKTKRKITQQMEIIKLNIKLQKKNNTTNEDKIKHEITTKNTK